MSEWRYHAKTGALVLGIAATVTALVVFLAVMVPRIQSAYYAQFSEACK